MPEVSPDVPPPLRRAIPIVPVAIAFVLVVAAAIFAWSHLAVRGPAPQRDATAAETATGQTEPDRAPYGPGGPTG